MIIKCIGLLWHQKQSVCLPFQRDRVTKHIWIKRGRKDVVQTISPLGYTFGWISGRWLSGDLKLFWSDYRQSDLNLFCYRVTFLRWALIAQLTRLASPWPMQIQSIVPSIGSATMDVLPSSHVSSTISMMMSINGATLLTRLENNWKVRKKGPNYWVHFSIVLYRLLVVIVIAMAVHASLTQQHSTHTTSFALKRMDTLLILPTAWNITFAQDGSQREWAVPLVSKL